MINKKALLVIGCIVLFNYDGYGQKQLVIAHRGASGYATENTLTAVKLAIQQKANAIEVDIWRTLDDSLVVFHDRDTKRLTGDSIVIPEVTYDQLRALALPGGEYIPTLREVLNELPRNRKIFIEIKCCWEKGRAGEVFPYLKTILEETNTKKQAVLISFNIEKLEDAKKYLPKTPCFLLAYKTMEPQEFIKKVRQSGIDGINVHHSMVTAELIGAIRASGYGFYVWTVDDLQIASALRKNKGVNGITTNIPDKVLKISDH